MPYPNRRGGGGGSGFALGEPNNVFGATSGAGESALTTVSPAATRAAAEGVRDTYDTNNPTWLPNYTDQNVNIILYYLSGSNRFIQYQRRVATEWVNAGPAIPAIQGESGDAASLANLTERHVGMKVGDELVDSGIEIETTGVVRIPGQTLGIEDLLEVSEGTGFLLLHNTVTQANFIILDAMLSDTAGSSRPNQFFVDGDTIEDRAFQDVEDTQITANPLSATYTTTLNAATFRIVLKTFAAMSNVKIRLLDNTTNIPFKFIPSKLAWDNDTAGEPGFVPGLEFRNGENTLDFFSNAADDPVNGLFNVGNSPLLLDPNRVVRLEVKADNVALLGNSSSVPYFVGHTGIATFRGIAYQDEIGGASQPVEPGRDFRFKDGELNYNGLVYKVQEGVEAINFGDGTLDIPGLSDPAFQTIGSHLVLQEDGGLIFARVTGVTSGGNDVEATVTQTVSFTDGGEFTVPNIDFDAHVGAMKSVIDPDTEVAFENVRAGSGQVLGDDFNHPAYTNSREITFTLANDFEAQYAVANLFIPNKTALGPAAVSSANAGVITSARVNPNNALQVIVDLTTGITLANNEAVELYDVTSETIRHIVVQSGATAEVDNGTLTLTPGMSPGEGGVTYAGDTPDNNELIVGTGSASTAKASGITLNAQGRIPFSSVGDADVVLSGSGGSLTIDVNNIEQYRDRTIFVDHTNTFTINLDDIDDFHDADDGPFFLRFVQLNDRILAVQGITSQTVGGVSQFRIPQGGSLTTELPPEGQTNWPNLGAGNPLRRFDIVQVTTDTSYPDDAALEFICDHLIEVDGTDVDLTFAPSTLDCAFWVHNQGTSVVTLGGISGASFDGHKDLQPGDLTWVWNISANSVYRSIKLGNSIEPIFLPDNRPVLDSLLNKSPGNNPGANMNQFISFSPNWVGARNVRAEINGVVVTIGSVTPSALGRLVTARYTISPSQWNSIYAGSPTSILAEIQVEIDSVWTTVYEIDVTV